MTVMDNEKDVESIPHDAIATVPSAPVGDGLDASRVAAAPESAPQVDPAVSAYPAPRNDYSEYTTPAPMDVESSHHPYPPTTSYSAPTRVYSHSDEERMGHTCCHCCCDTRRATIIVDSLYLGLLFLGLITLEETGDDAVSSQSVDDETAVYVYVTLGFMMAASILGIVGAVQFNKYMVALILIPMTYELVVSLMYARITALVLLLLLAYPNIVFIREVHVGIMTPERYKIEETSCCCV